VAAQEKSAPNIKRGIPRILRDSSGFVFFLKKKRAAPEGAAMASSRNMENSEAYGA
jgi:hypothetical protein